MEILIKGSFELMKQLNISVVLKAVMGNGALSRADIAKITGAGYSVLTPVIISNTADYADVVPTDAKKVAALDALITVL